MKNIVAMVLAGGRNAGFGVLTQDRAKAALPYAGHYRLIDFALSSLADSGVERVGVIMQYLPGSLLDHLGTGQAWDYDGIQRRLKLMPPFVGVGDTDWYLGTADALRRNWNYAKRIPGADVLVCSGEHVFSIDFCAVVDFHRARGADLTIVTKRVAPTEESKRYGRLEFDAGTGRVVRFVEKPDVAFSDWISVGIYLFKSEALARALSAPGQKGLPTNLAREVVEPLARGGRAFAYAFDGQWEYVEDAGQYYESHRRLLDGGSAKSPVWEARTNMHDRGLGARVPAVFGPESETTRCIVSPGCRILGRVIHSVLSPGVFVGPGAEVRDSILLHDTQVGPGATVHRTISDKDVVFGAGCHIGLEVSPIGPDPSLPSGARNLTLIGKGVRVGAGARVPLGFQAPPASIMDKDSPEARSGMAPWEYAPSRTQH